MEKENFSKFGRSGCSFYLDNSNIILKKESSDPTYNERLYSQYVKQCEFKSNNGFYTPQPFDFDKSKELYAFDMEYIHGKTFETFCINSTASDIRTFSKNLNSLISDNLKNSILTEIDFNKLKVKLQILYKVLDPTSRPYIDYLLNNKLTKLPIGKNHGDLTMSNIIFADKYYLIDFLDNPYESPLNDLVKVKQDTEHGFYLSLLGKYSTKVKICLNYLDNELNNKFPDIIHTKEFIWLSIFNLLRVLPYMKDQQEKNTIIQNLKKYERYITGSGEI